MTTQSGEGGKQAAIPNSNQQLEAETQRTLGFRTPPCPLHFGIGYRLECVDCLAMPTIMPNGELRVSVRAVTMPFHWAWAMIERDRMWRSTR